jgi:hypothetical protein
VGASSWHYVQDVPPGRRVDLETALVRLQERVLASGDFYYSEAEWRAPRPATLTDLAVTRATEEFWEVGSHSILDVDRVIGAYAPDRDGTVRPLARKETKALFGTRRPGRERFEEVVTEAPPEVRRWSARCQVLFDGRRPVAVGFWGVSGD